MAKKPKSDLAKICCTVDRLSLNDGRLIIRDQAATVPEAEAKIYIKTERAKRG